MVYRRVRSRQGKRRRSGHGVRDKETHRASVLDIDRLDAEVAAATVDKCDLAGNRCRIGDGITSIRRGTSRAGHPSQESPNW